MWKGVIRIGRIQVPVKLYSALEAQDVHFRLLHAPDKEPVKQQMVNPETGEVVPHEQIRKAYEDEDVLVILDDEELAALEPEPSRDIEITRFVAAEDITPQWYDRPYYLGPDTSQGAYFALAEALSRQNRHGIARWVMRKKEYVGALVPEGEYLMLITLRHADEVILANELEPPAGRKPDAREIKLAEQLVSALESDFNPGEFQDEYRQRVLDFVEQKAKGRAPELKAVRPRRETARELTDVLEASLKAMQKERKSA
jgi:DNA end-binding protein Ku